MKCDQKCPLCRNQVTTYTKNVMLNNVIKQEAAVADLEEIRDCIHSLKKENKQLKEMVEEVVEENKQLKNANQKNRFMAENEKADKNSFSSTSFLEIGKAVGVGIGVGVSLIGLGALFYFSKEPVKMEKKKGKAVEMLSKVLSASDSVNRGLEDAAQNFF